MAQLGRGTIGDGNKMLDGLGGFHDREPERLGKGAKRTRRWGLGQAIEPPKDSTRIDWLASNQPRTVWRTYGCSESGRGEKNGEIARGWRIGRTRIGRQCRR